MRLYSLSIDMFVSIKVTNRLTSKSISFNIVQQCPFKQKIDLFTDALSNPEFSLRNLITLFFHVHLNHPHHAIH